MSDDGGKKTADLPRPGPHEAKTVLDLSNIPIILEEVRGLRRDGIERGNVVKTLETAFKGLDTAVKGVLVQLQQYYELFGGKIRVLEGRADATDLRAAGHEAQLAELKKQLEARITDLEKQIEAARTQLATLGDTKLGVSVLPGVQAQISLSEEDMAKKLEEEAKAHAAKLAQEKAEREAADAAVDKRVEARILPMETQVREQSVKMDTLLTALNVRPPPPKNPDGSIPPSAMEKRKPEKNAIEKQARLVKVAVAIVSAVGTGGVLDKIGVLDWLRHHFFGQ